MGFEEFKKNRQYSPSEAVVTVRKSKSIGVSSAVVDEYFSEADGAVVYYDEGSNRIGLEPVGAGEDLDAYTLTVANGSGSIDVSELLERYNLVPDETRVYDPEWDDDRGMLIIDLDNPKY